MQSAAIERAPRSGWGAFVRRAHKSGRASAHLPVCGRATININDDSDSGRASRCDLSHVRRPTRIRTRCASSDTLPLVRHAGARPKLSSERMSSPTAPTQHTARLVNAHARPHSGGLRVVGPQHPGPDTRPPCERPRRDAANGSGPAAPERPRSGSGEGAWPR